jgi:hypothetical protein
LETVVMKSETLNLVKTDQHWMAGSALQRVAVAEVVHVGT